MIFGARENHENLFARDQDVSFETCLKSDYSLTIIITSYCIKTETPEAHPIYTELEGNGE